MKATKVFLAISIVIVASGAFYRLGWHRYKCNLVKGRAANLLHRAYEARSDFQRRRIAKETLLPINSCLQVLPADCELYILRGIAEDITGQKERALRSFQLALNINERPEIYANIGLIEFNQGRVAEATEHLTRAAIFNIQVIPFDLPIFSAIEQSVVARKAHLENAKRARELSQSRSSAPRLER